MILCKRVLVVVVHSLRHFSSDVKMSLIFSAFLSDPLFKKQLLLFRWKDKNIMVFLAMIKFKKTNNHISSILHRNERHQQSSS